MVQEASEQYYARRAAQQRQRAEEAANPRIAALHIELVGIYEDRLNETGASVIPLTDVWHAVKIGTKKS